MEHKVKIGIARMLRADSTAAERLLWSRLRNNGIPGFRFRRQYPVRPYFADFCCASARLIIEIDGGQHAERSAEDGKRTEYLERNGYRVMRFWNNEVLARIDGVLEEISRGLQAPHPPLSPRGERDKK